MDPRRQQPSSTPLVLEALSAALRRRLAYEVSAGVLHAGRLDRSRGPSLIATPRDFRPFDLQAGREILAGRFTLAGTTLEVGPGGDPWDQPSPSRQFAAALHGFDWVQGLLGCGEAGAREALRLFLDWRRQFYRPNRFVWSAEVLERRLYNLACAAKRMGGVASDLEASILFKTLLHQARYLRRVGGGEVQAATRCAVAVIAASALGGREAARLAADQVAQLGRALPRTILADGGLRSRAPEAALELLFDLLTLDDVLLQRGREPPLALSRAIDRLSSAVRFFTLRDGRLASFQGGDASDTERIRAATGQDEGEGGPAGQAPYSGYHRLSGPTLEVVVDAAPTARAGWSLAACAQPLAIEVVGGEDRLFVNSGWSARAVAPHALRLTAGGNTAQLDDASTGRLLSGFLARSLGARLVAGPNEVAALRNESEAGVWLELAHDGWERRFGLVHARRLYVDTQIDELRGEDAFSPAGPPRRGRTPRFAIRFHAHPDVQVSLARDGVSVLLRGVSNRGWWFRNDAEYVSVEPSVVFEHGRPRRTVQVVLSGEVGSAGSARIRWKLTPVEGPAPKLRLRSTLAWAAAHAPSIPTGQAESGQVESGQAEQSEALTTGAPTITARTRAEEGDPASEPGPQRGRGAEGAPEAEVPPV